MKKFLFWIILFFINEVYAQNFPFNISPLSSPYQVNAIQPIEKLRSGNSISGNQNEDSYAFLNTVSLQGIKFNKVHLKFQNNQLVGMTFYIENKGDLQKIISALSSKYKKGHNTEK